MHSRLLFIYAFVLGFEFYAYQAAVTVFGSFTGLPWIYFSITGFLLLCITFYFNAPLKKRIGIPPQIILGSFFMLFIPKVFTSILLLIEDGFRLIKLLANGIIAVVGTTNFEFGIERSVTWSIIAMSIAGILSLTFIYGAIFNVYNYKVRNVPIKLLKLPKPFNGLKVVQISDIHSGSLSDKEAVLKAVTKINLLKPDIIFFTGDLVNNMATEAVDFVEIFSQLSAKQGVYSVLGNHDYGDYMQWPDETAKSTNLKMLKSLHEQMGWRLLLNEHVSIEIADEKIVIAGVENWSASNRFHSYGKLEEALHGVQDEATVLLLSHDPSHWEAEVLNHPAAVDVTFSGHTHGMQFGFEIFNFKWSPVKYIYKQWAGLYSNKNQHLYVNRGFGVIGYPGRVGIMPEITLFTLHAAHD
jgi:uncharacterized protein